MPYITSDKRAVLGTGESPKDKGDLTYVLAVTINAYIAHKGRSFDTFGDVWAALASARNEFERRIVNPYEDHKIELHGDVPGYDE